ncbi:hypothetical protein LEMLEM_LOCUS23794 [Lemmus lemmus]
MSVPLEASRSELGLQMEVNHSAGAGNQTKSSGRAASLLTAEPSLQLHELSPLSTLLLDSAFGTSTGTTN